MKEVNYDTCTHLTDEQKVELDSLKEVFMRPSAFYLENRRKAFLRYTTLFYNANNRAERGGACVYTPVYDLYTDDLKSPGCAIGQHLENPPFVIRAVDGISEDLPEWMFSLGISFLRAVQTLHDMSSLWDDFGIVQRRAEYRLNNITKFINDEGTSNEN